MTAALRELLQSLALMRAEFCVRANQRAIDRAKHDLAAALDHRDSLRIDLDVRSRLAHFPEPEFLPSWCLKENVTPIRKGKA